MTQEQATVPQIADQTTLGTTTVPQHQDDWETQRIEVSCSRETAYLDADGEIQSAFQNDELVVRLVVTQRHRTNKTQRTVGGLYVFAHGDVLPPLLVEETADTLHTLERLFTSGARFSVPLRPLL